MLYVFEDIWSSEVPTSKNMISRRILKHQYGVDLQKSLEESCLLQATGKQAVIDVEELRALLKLVDCEL